MRILLTGGGSAGHVTPILTIVQAIKRQYSGPLSFLWVGSKDGFESRFAAEAKIPFKAVAVGKIRRYFSLQNIVDIFRIPVGICQALRIIHQFKPDVVFGKGGFASFPAVVAAWILRKPVVIHDSDAVPGLANRWAAKFARKVAVSFPSSKKFFKEDKVVLTGNPIRREVMQGEREKAIKRFSLKEDKPTLFVWGGSQGSQKINDLVIEILPKLLDDFQIVHQTGQEKFLLIKKKTAFLAKQDYRPVPFLTDELKDVLALADIVISRAGSNSIAELLATKKPMILIPLSTAAQNHQHFNAKSLFDENAALMLDETKATPHQLSEMVIGLWENKPMRQRLSQAAWKLARVEAARDVAKIILEMVEKEPIKEEE